MILRKIYFGVLIIFLNSGSLWSQSICITEMEQEILHLINTKREEAGLNMVVISQPLMMLANYNMKEIVDKSYLVYAPGELKGTEYAGEIGTIRTSTSNTEPDRIVNSLSTASEYTRNYQVIFNKEEFANSNWKSIGICVRIKDDGFTGVYLIFGNTIASTINPSICSSPIFFDAKVKTDPILKINVTEDIVSTNPNFVCVIFFVDANGEKKLDPSCPYFFKKDEAFMIYLREPGIIKYEIEIMPQHYPIVPQEPARFSVTNFDDDTIYQSVTLYGNSVKEVEKLLATGFTIDQTDPNDPFEFTMLHRAIIRDNLEVVNYLLTHKSDINKFSKGNELPINFCKSDAMFNYLLAYNPILDYVDSYGGNLLHCLASNGCLAGVKYLVEVTKLDVNAVESHENNTPLGGAVSYNHYDVTKYLLENGANPNVKSWGSYPIQNAVYNSNLEMVKLLIEYKANPYVENENGTSPYEYAKIIADTYKDATILNYFDSIGVDPNR